MATDLNISGARKTLSSWEAQRDELLALRSIYCEEGECEVIAPANVSFETLPTAEPNGFASPDHGGIVVRINIGVQLQIMQVEQATVPQGLCLSIVFHLGAGYPEEPPAVTEISSKDLPSHVTECIHKRLSTFISSLQPEPCLFDALERLKEEVVDLVAQDTSLLSTPTLALKGRDSCSSDNDDLVNHPVIKDCNNVIMASVRAAEDQADTCDQASKGDGAKQIDLGGIPQVHVCIAKLDHMRNEQKYFKLLNSWAKELALYGKVLHTGPHSIYVVIIGVNDSGGASVSEFLKRWRTQNVDVDSQGRPCKERLLSVLCQQQLSGCPDGALGSTPFGTTVR